MKNIELKGFEQLNELYELDSKPEGELLSTIDLDALTASKFQPRHDFDETQLQELSNSIKAQGVIQPIIARRVSENKYEIIAGERRWRAAKLAGLKSIPAIVKSVDDDTAHVYAVIENIQRDNLNPIEEALAFSRFRDDSSMSHADIAKLVGKSRAAITNSLRLLNLDQRVIVSLTSNSIDMGHARAVLSLDRVEQIEVIERVILKKLSVRQTESLVSTYLNESKKQDKNHLYCESHVADLQTELADILSTKAKIKLNCEGKGKIVIPIHSISEIEKLISKLKAKIRASD